MVSYFEMKYARKQKDRRSRKNQDILLKIISILSALTALIIIVAFMLLARAKPGTFHSLTHNLPLRGWWSPSYSRYLLYLAIFGFASSSIGIYVNMKRLKRKYDYVRYNFIFLWFASIIGIAVYAYFN